MPHILQRVPPLDWSGKVPTLMQLTDIHKNRILHKTYAARQDQSGTMWLHDSTATNTLWWKLQCKCTCAEKSYLKKCRLQVQSVSPSWLVFTLPSSNTLCSSAQPLLWQVSMSVPSPTPAHALRPCASAHFCSPFTEEGQTYLCSAYTTHLFPQVIPDMEYTSTWLNPSFAACVMM